METLKAVYINELFKISKKKKFMISLLFSFCLVILTAIVVYFFNNFAGIHITGSSDFSIMVLTILSYSLLPLFTAFIAIDMFTGEFSDGTIKFTLTRLAPRFKVFLGKILAIATFIIVNLIIIMILSLVLSVFINKSMPDVLRIVAAYTMAFFPQLIFAFVVVFVSNISKGTSSAFVLSILIFLGFNGCAIIFSDFKSFLFTTTFDWYTLILGTYINFAKILRMFLILLGYAIMFFTASYYFFEKRDV